MSLFFEAFPPTGAPPGGSSSVPAPEPNVQNEDENSERTRKRQKTATVDSKLAIPSGDPSIGRSSPSAARTARGGVVERRRGTTNQHVDTSSTQMGKDHRCDDNSPAAVARSFLTTPLDSLSPSVYNETTSSGRNDSVDPDSPSNAMALPELFVDMILWLTWALRRLPSLYHDRNLTDGILALGKATKDNKFALFDQIRLECSTRLMMSVAKVDPAQQREHEERGDAEAWEKLTEDAIQREVLAMVRWINRLGRGYQAEEIVDRHIISMIRAGRREPGVDHTFRSEKARCIAQICLKFGRYDGVPTSSWELSELPQAEKICRVTSHWPELG